MANIKEWGQVNLKKYSHNSENSRFVPSIHKQSSYYNSTLTKPTGIRLLLHFNGPLLLWPCEQTDSNSPPASGNELTYTKTILPSFSDLPRRFDPLRRKSRRSIAMIDDDQCRLARQNIVANRSIFTTSVSIDHYQPSLWITKCDRDSRVELRKRFFIGNSVVGIRLVLILFL